MYDTYDSSNINFVALSDMDVTGTWTLDGMKQKQEHLQNKINTQLN